MSLVLLCVGFALTAHDVYRTMDLSNEAAREAECRRLAGSGQKAERACGNVYIDEDKRGPWRVALALDALLTVGEATLPQDTFFAVIGAIFGRLLAFTVCLGLAASLLLAAVPWVVFYLARWIARGFA